jgi:6-phosphogluconate dehydrogenase
MSDFHFSNPTAHVGLVGLGTMGQNLALNLASKQIKVSLFNRNLAKTQDFLAKNRQVTEYLAGFASLGDFVQSLPKPRRIILMVPAGAPVDAVLSDLSNWLETGDIVLDGGNSNWRDTEARQARLAQINVDLIGCGISGGSEGALHGPSLMPGGKSQAIDQFWPILSQIAAKDRAGQACVSKLGPGGSGHFVKMVHNGIEYAMMQSIAEIYDHLKNGLGLTQEQIIEVFDFANQDHRPTKSYLLDVTLAVLQSKDPQHPDQFLVDKISPVSGSKGTGKWTVENALDLGVPVPSIAEALFVRYASADCQLQNQFTNQNLPSAPASRLSQPGQTTKPFSDLCTEMQTVLKDAFLSIFYQGLNLLNVASRTQGWHLDISQVLRIWEGGCIIRTNLLSQLKTELESSDLVNQLPAVVLKPSFSMEVLTKFLTPAPVLNSAMQYLFIRTQNHLPTNLIQAQRDFFGQHGYQRIDEPGVFSGGWKK